MSERIDLDACAKDAVRNAIIEDLNKGFSKGDLQQAVTERLFTIADIACIYTDDCMQIISEYERAAFPSADEYQGEAQYKAADWKNALAAWAYFVALAYLSQAAKEPIQEALDARERVLEVAQGLGFDGDVDVVEASHECPHGWAPHDYEEDDGVCVWQRLDGECMAVSLDAVGLCFSVCWAPASDDEESSRTKAGH